MDAVIGDSNTQESNATAQDGTVVQDTSSVQDAAAVQDVTELQNTAVVETTDAYEKLNTGKRNLACDEYPQAVDALAEACRLLSEKFGDQGDELAEPYYYYGKALLELARMENGVLGNALDGVPVEEENEAELSESDQFEKAGWSKEEERDDVRTQIYSAMAADEKDAEQVSDKNEKQMGENADDNGADTGEACGNSEEKATESTEEDQEMSADEEENTGEQVDPENKENVEDETNKAMGEEESAEEATSSQDEGDDNPDDVPNLQLAWEVLELSKKIYLRLTENPECNNDLKIKLSEVYRTLGEVSLETGSSDQAVQDMLSCLEIQQNCLESDSRLIAETHYQLGNAYLLCKNYKAAVEAIHKAKNVIETRIGNIEQLETAEEKLQKELQELKQLLPDVISKVEDAEDECRNAERAEAEVKSVITSRIEGNTTVGFDSNPADGAAVPTIKANDISNLVRKRKPEELPEDEVKKVKCDVDGAGDKENGHMDESTAVDAVNGH